jgi:cytochrome c oxidase subunit 2
MLSNLPLFPQQASTVAKDVDALFYFLVGVSAFFALLVATLLIVFAVRYRRRSDAERPQAIEGALQLEMLWTLIPFGLSMVMFVWSASIYVKLQRPPDNALQVFVVGKQWMWKLQHIEGQREINELHVPVGRPVKLTMTSEDVIHSFYVPAFRIKQDVIPGRYTTTWFEATKPGVYHLFCTEYCGTQHSGMIGSVIVMEPAEFATWLSGGAKQSLASAGETLFQQLGCATCHLDEGNGRGPVLTGLLGKQVQLTNGTTIVADETYVRESILTPQAKIVAGYQPIMPTFKGLVSEEQLLQLVAYIKAKGGPSGAGAAAGMGAGAPGS